jgi:prepilin-type N-terminal cleavage/methylation domain-containing protein
MTQSTTRIAGADRRGFTLIEIMMALFILAVVSVAFTKVVRTQVRFADRQASAKDARDISRSGLNALLTDIRMVDADSGIVVATRDSFTVLAPYAEGIVCGPNNGATGSVIALLPYDSLTYAEGGYSGYAYIDTTTTGVAYQQRYQYVKNSTTPIRLDSAATATSAPCRTSTDTVSIFKQGAVLVQPAIPVQSRYQAAMLVRYITYSFKPSATIPGARGLYRRVVNGPRGDEELVAPFDTGAQFRYYLTTGVKQSSVTGSSLTQIRGIELQLDAKSDRTVPGSATPPTAPMTTAIFFKNRPLH